ncbi:MAG TPA: neutral zinc metallopeptidase [Aquihabitans sp.]|nr:neutral zinc metallopeptidase [Aquihabitans sp.]
MAVALACLAAGCGVEATDGGGTLATGGGGAGDGEVVGSDITPTTASVPSTTTPPPPDIEVEGDDGSELNKVAINAIADLEDYWAEVYPEVYGDEYEPLSGGLFAVDTGTDPSGLPCAPSSIEDVLQNAYYCPPDDAVAWDQELLFPALAEQFGDFAVAVVLAHEWGHAIQARAAVDEPTVITELQADCFAGAWVEHVRSDDSARFDISTEDLDLALAGILSLKDAPGSLATDPNAHGSGFDRVGAFQEGFEDGPARCAEYTDGDPVPYQFPFSQNDLATGGDLPFTETDGVEGIDTSAFASLELYWEDAFPEISGGEDWEPLEEPVPFSPADPPSCNGREVDQFRLFLCVPDRYVGYDAEETMPDAYEFGDFAVGVLFGTQYGLAVQDQLGLEAPDEVTATLRGDCYAGSWAAAILPAEVDQEEFPYELLLSPGDLDEAVAVLLSFRSDSDRERQGPGFERVRAFRTGVVRGAEECDELEAPDT